MVNPDGGKIAKRQELQPSARPVRTEEKLVNKNNKLERTRNIYQTKGGKKLKPPYLANNDSENMVVEHNKPEGGRKRLHIQKKKKRRGGKQIIFIYKLTKSQFFKR